MKIGIIGACAMGSALDKLWAATGRSILIGAARDATHFFELLSSC